MKKIIHFLVYVFFVLPFLILWGIVKLPGYICLWYYRIAHGILTAILGKTGLDILRFLKWSALILLGVYAAVTLTPAEILPLLQTELCILYACIIAPYDLGFLIHYITLKPYGWDRKQQGYAFEYAVAKRLRWYGYHNIKVTPSCGDFGADIIANKGFTRYAIQCKFYSGAVGIKAVQEALSGKAYYDCDKAMVITNSTFTPAAIELAKKSKVKLKKHFRA